jgi:hypothetical protein
VNNGNEGLPPPKLGPPSRIDEEAFLAICQLVFSWQSTEQANCAADRLDRQQMMSKVGEIVNAKICAENFDELNDVAFYE